MHYDGILGLDCSSILSGLIFADVKSGAILKDLTFDFCSYRFQMFSEICGGNVSLKAGLDGI